MFCNYTTYVKFLVLFYIAIQIILYVWGVWGVLYVQKNWNFNYAYARVSKLEYNNHNMGFKKKCLFDRVINYFSCK